MSEQKKSKSIPVGKLLLAKNGKTQYLVLGNQNPKGKPEFNYTVDIRITKANGEKVTKTNAKLFLNDPRTFAKDPSKIPDFILSDVVLLEDNE